MDIVAMIVSVVLVLAVVGTLLALMLVRRKRSDWFLDQYGPEYTLAVQTMGTEKKAQKELLERRKHLETLTLRLLTRMERERYLEDWNAVQAKFVDQPAQAVAEADRLIMEVMQKRDYPVSDFDQRAADLSVQYPTLVSNYRAAREISQKYQNNLAGTEALRQAFIYYRSLFDELLKIDPTLREENWQKTVEPTRILPRVV